MNGEWPVDIVNKLTPQLGWKDQQRAARLLRVRVHTSPSSTLRGEDHTLRAARPVGHQTIMGVKPQLVKFSDRKLVLFDDGSFRNVPRRRRFAGLSGRQLRIARKLYRRQVKAEALWRAQQEALAFATPLPVEGV